MSYVVNLYDLSHGRWLGYLTRYDPDYRADGAATYPTGQVAASPRLADALRFDTIEAAVELLDRTSQRVPERPDGRPNKPISAFTVEIVHAPVREQEPT